MINKNDLRKAISSIAISNAKRNTIYKAFSDLASITKEEFDSVKSDISKVVESMLTKDTVGKANGVASLDSNGSVPIEQLGNIDTTLFLIVRELPTTDIKANKIYLVPNKDGQGNNVYIEYLYVEDVWEKLGEFKPEVDLSMYIKYGTHDSDSIAIDCRAEANKSSVAVGVLAKARYSKAVAIGYGAEAENEDIAIGNNTVVNGKYCIAIGNRISLNKFIYYSTVIGYNASTNNTSATVIGANATASNGAIALGANATASNNLAVAIGKNAKNNKSIFSVGFNGVNGIDMDADNYGLYLKGFGGYTGTNLTTNNAADEEVLNPDIKSVQQIINEKADASAIPTKLSQLTNDANFITSYTETDPVWSSEKDNYYTKTEIDNKGYLTEHQSLDAYAKKTEIPNVSTKADLVNGKLKAEQLPKLVNITTASTAEEVVTKFNALLADLKAKGYMEADIAQ